MCILVAAVAVFSWTKSKCDAKYKTIKLIIAFAIVHLFDLTTSSKPYQTKSNACTIEYVHRVWCLLQFPTETTLYDILMIYQKKKKKHFFRFSFCASFISRIFFCVCVFEMDSDEQFDSAFYFNWNKRQNKNVMKLFGLQTLCVCVTWPLIQNKSQSFGFIAPTREKKRGHSTTTTTKGKWNKTKIKSIIRKNEINESRNG